jgi:hypothetical protein
VKYNTTIELPETITSSFGTETSAELYLPRFSAISGDPCLPLSIASLFNLTLSSHVDAAPPGDSLRPLAQVQPIIWQASTRLIGKGDELAAFEAGGPLDRNIRGLATSAVVRRLPRLDLL